MSFKIISFIYSKIKYEIFPKSEDINDSLKDFSNIVKIDLSELYFFYNGKYLNKNKKLKQYVEKKIIIFAFNIKKKLEKDNCNNIKCPECNNSALITINSDKITVNNCCNKHYANMTLNEFIESQNIDDLKSTCDICGNEQNLYGEKFKFCTCKKKMCSLCESIHDRSHVRIEYKDRFIRCRDHGNKFETYCFNCNLNLCPLCEVKHIKHKIIFRKSMLINDTEFNRMKNFYSELKDIYKEFKIELYKIENIICNTIKSIESNIDEYIKINENNLLSIEQFDIYESIKNVASLNDNNKLIKKEMVQFLKSNFKNKLKIITDIYEKKPKNELTMIYKNEFYNQKQEEDENNENGESTEDVTSANEIDLRSKSVKLVRNFTMSSKSICEYDIISIEKDDNKKMIKVFGRDFVENNKNNCYLMINGKKYPLKEYLPLKKDYNRQTVKIKLVKEKPIKDMSYMFEDCINLLSFSDNSDYWENPETLDMKYMFSNCSSLINLPNMNCWDTSNVTDMQYIFNNCSSLKTIPDISNWKMSQVQSLSNMFKDCKSLISLPDISKWDTQKLQETEKLFFNCSL